MWLTDSLSGQIQARLPTGAKLVGGTDRSKSAGRYLASKSFVLKGLGGDVRRVIFPLIFYQLSVFPQPRGHQLVLTQSLSKLF